MEAIKAIDLRIGNLVLVNNIKAFVESVNDFGINLSAEGTYYGGALMDYEGIFNESRNHFQIKPIELTEEWLIKMGFEKSNADYWFTRDGIQLGYITTDKNFQLEYKIGSIVGKWRLIEVKYVHSLQNLYYALTGTELTIKL